MLIKVASICPTTEKEVRNGELIHQYAYPQATLDEAVALANAMVDRMVPMIERAAAEGAQIACLPEGLPNLGRWRRDAPLSQRQEAWKRTWDHFCATLSAAARRFGIHLIAGGVEPKNGCFYNSGALFDDGGNLLGCYHKVQLAAGEDQVLTRGDSFPVFPTRLGNIGIFICWDIIFPEVTQALMLNGADILFEPTYGHAGAQADFMAQTRAHDAVCPLVISMWCGNGRVIDRDGTILARGQMIRDWCGLIPDQIVYGEVDPTAGRKWIVHEDLRQELIRTRQWQAYAPLTDPSRSLQVQRCSAPAPAPA